MVPRAVLMRSSATRTTTTAQRKRPFQNKVIVSTAKAEAVSTTEPNVITDTVVGNHFYVVKASACWVWKPRGKVLNHVSRDSSASMDLK